MQALVHSRVTRESTQESGRLDVAGSAPGGAKHA